MEVVNEKFVCFTIVFMLYLKGNITKPASSSCGWDSSSEVNGLVKSINDNVSVSWDFTKRISEPLIFSDVVESSDCITDPSSNSSESWVEVLKSEREVGGEDCSPDFLVHGENTKKELSDLLDHWSVSIHWAGESSAGAFRNEERSIWSSTSWFNKTVSINSVTGTLKSNPESSFNLSISALCLSFPGEFMGCAASQVSVSGIWVSKLSVEGVHRLGQNVSLFRESIGDNSGGSVRGFISLVCVDSIIVIILNSLTASGGFKLSPVV